MIGLLLLSNAAFAHQPNIVSDENVVNIELPQISKAFYGELKGREHYFQITSDKKFSLYIQITLPDLPGINRDINAEIVKMQEGKEVLVKTLEGKDFNWTPFYEPFGADNYLEGPDYSNPSAEAGSYLIKVYNENNTGKYVLVTGKTEEFPVMEILHTIKVLPQVKTFFEKSPYTAYLNLSGAFMLFPVLLILIIIKIVMVLMKRS